MNEFIAMMIKRDGTSIAKISSSMKEEILKSCNQFNDINRIPKGNIIDYVGADSLKSKENDEWFRIKLTKIDKDKIIDIFSESRVDLAAQDFKDIDYIANVTTNCINIEKIFKVKGKAKSGIYFIDNQIKYLPEVIGVAISGIVSAKYFTNEPYLYFWNFNHIKQLLSNPEEYMPEATKQEIEIFKNYSCISYVNEFEFGIRNKKKIKLYMEVEGKILDDTSNYKKLQRYALKNGIKLFNDNGKIDIDCNKRLSEVLDVLNRYYFKDPITNDRYLAGSKKLVKIK